MSTEPLQKWGTILLIGGAGRLGYFVAKALMHQPEVSRVISINRSENVAHPYEGVEYRAVDLRDNEKLRSLMQELKPETIINVAAPAHANNRLTPKSEFEEVIVNAQQRMLELAKEVGTKYFVCTTSANVVAGDEHNNVDETSPMWSDDADSFAYWVQRARAEKLLLAADSSALQTVSIRLPLIIGEKDYSFVPNMITVHEDGRTRFQIGDNKGLLTTISGDDAARGHVLALRGLMKPDNNVHGEAFYIIGKDPLPFWTMGRIIWTLDGWEETKPPIVVPRWLVWIVAYVSEMVTRPFGKEPQISRHVLQFMCNNWTYNGTKARERLGYVAQDDTKDALTRGVRWFQENRETAAIR